MSESEKTSNDEKREPQHIRVFGKRLSSAGHILLSKAWFYNQWFFRKILKPLERDLLLMLLGQAYHRGGRGRDEWLIKVPLETLTYYMGYGGDTSRLSAPFRGSRDCVVICPICGQKISPLLTATKTIKGHYEINLRPFRDILEHLHDEWKLAPYRYEDHRDAWVEAQKDPNRKKRMSTVRSHVSSMLSKLHRSAL